MKMLAIIQARLGSSRLPGKVLQPILGKPMLWHIVDRLSQTPSIEEIVVAVPSGPKDEPLRRFCKQEGIPLFEGSEHDVLDRYYQAAKLHGGDPILRITADCPLVDPLLIQELCELYQSGKYDHVGVATGAGAENLRVGRFPDGLDGECFSFSALERAWTEATDPRDREHVTRYMWSNRQLFRCGDIKSKQPYPSLRLTVDTREDFLLVTKIYEALYSPAKPFLLDQVIDLLKQNPNLCEINRNLTEQSNYTKILEN
jgi:spore coat polysaccharide biosynthesis protein SpsF